MEKKNVTVKEEYIARIKRKDNGKYIFTAHPCMADTLEKCKARFEDYRKQWESCSAGLDFNCVEFVHRTVITTEWEVVG